MNFWRLTIARGPSEQDRADMNLYGNGHWEAFAVGWNSAATFGRYPADAVASAPGYTCDLALASLIHSIRRRGGVVVMP